MTVRFSPNGYWIRYLDGVYRVGMTPQLVTKLGKVVFVDPPKPGEFVRQNHEHGMIETVKAVADLDMPISGTISAINSEISYDPARVSDDPTGFGWLFEIAPSDRDELRELLEEPVEIDADSA